MNHAYIAHTSTIYSDVIKIKIRFVVKINLLIFLFLLMSLKFDSILSSLINLYKDLFIKIGCPLLFLKDG